MKQLYLLCSVVLLLHVGATAHEVESHTSSAATVYKHHHPNPSSMLMQNASNISGRVTDENGSPFPGVNVVVKGTSTGTVTAVDGR